MGEDVGEDGELASVTFEKKVEKLVQKWKDAKGGSIKDSVASPIYPVPTLIPPTTLLNLSTLPQPTIPTLPTITLHRHPSPLPFPSSPLHLPLAYNPAKQGITPCVDPSLTFLSSHFDQSGPQPFIIAGEDDAKDESVGIAIVILQEFFDEEGRFLDRGTPGVKGTPHRSLELHVSRRNAAYRSCLM